MSRLARLVVAFIVTAIVLFTAAQQAGGVGPWWLELTRYLPYPGVLLPAVAALLLSCWLGRGWVLASLAALVLVLTVTMGFAWPRPDHGDLPVRVMTYNVKAHLAAQRPDGLAKLAREVALHAPDILVMQDAGLSRNGGPEATLPAAALFGFAHVFAAGQYVVASRFPLRDCAQGNIGYRGEDHRYVHCVVEASGVALNLVTAHFESPREGLNAARREGLEGVDDWQQNYEDRLAQARTLARDLAGSGRPLVVAGDLNAPESSPVIGALLGIGLRDAFSSAGRGYGYTHGHALKLGFSFLRIDHILLSADIGVSDSFAGNADASEHRPVIADLLLRRQ
jgi:endonuclease/exonuclease/phosphatase (EEP) superfamily protein YafD